MFKEILLDKQKTSLFYIKVYEIYYKYQLGQLKKNYSSSNIFNILDESIMF